MGKQANLTTFYIVRHGQTEWNVKGLTQGHSDSPLTEEGISQAANLAKKLSDIKFDLVFSSDLLRAQRTAEIITNERKLEILETKMLRERWWGKFEGTDYETLHKQWDILTDLEKAELERSGILEPEKEVVQRLMAFLRETAIAYPEKTVLVVTHGGVMSRFLKHLGFWEGKRPVDAISNGAVVKLESDGIDFFIKETDGIKK